MAGMVGYEKESGKEHVWRYEPLTPSGKHEDEYSDTPLKFLHSCWGPFPGTKSQYLHMDIHARFASAKLPPQAGTAM
eukprot:scaffold34655_cov20-Tisochrysis_lutea.AAC.1